MVIDGNEIPSPYILLCESGLITPLDGKKGSDPKTDPWVVRGAIFAFIVSCKFAISSAAVNTGKMGDDDEKLEDKYPMPKDATPDIFVKPMKLEKKIYSSHLAVTIRPVKLKTKGLNEFDKPLNPF